ncbi:MAG: hypothetical protein K9N47_17450 [Prosthecobacter sp.]|uniref:hypothetical protein n=1 Tax=Prosthecobacter sp. TaxID=1965333 RepID=UPI0025DC2E3E|nr:hypothetical protein [Prosthecobacter sp.]MCF7787910.1 hypothetical protein [Prosthecobacter sp.]
MNKLITFLALLTFPAFGESLRLTTFRADVTPPVGAPLCGGLVKPVVGVSEPLLALGVVILSDDRPVVLCAVDWCEIRAGDHVHWREVLAQAAGTTPERVAVQSLHQHNAPLADSASHRLLAGCASPPSVIDIEWAERALKGVAASLEAALKKAEPVTHMAHGEAAVEHVASNRRIMGEDGKVAKMRLSSTKDAALRELPEGVVDPQLKTISFWNGEKKIAVLHYYATHPMSYYGDGMVTSDFVGTARERRTQDDGVPHLYFTGCGGNIAAGKYNDASKESRVRLGENIHAAMVKSEQQMKRLPLTKIEWRARPVVLKSNPEFPEERMLKVCENATTAASTRISAAFRVGFIRQSAAGVPIQFTSLHLGDDVCLLHLPGETFIEYQLFAQQQRPGGFVATASYGDGAPGYIPLEKSFVEGGYEPTQAFAAPESEKVMRETIVELLRAK